MKQMLQKYFFPDSLLSDRSVRDYNTWRKGKRSGGSVPRPPPPPRLYHNSGGGGLEASIAEAEASAEEGGKLATYL